ncbi:TonB-dependent receptor [Spirosoma sp. SC4-14]|uniref:TonB-dependent receptor n=1 Tax=Spirosoma sp. SC4-14 TaxID=3128900 RepID=UPI0030D04DDF
MRAGLQLLLCLFILLPVCAQKTDSRITISGYVREAGSLEALIGVSVYVPATTMGTTTNTYGFYSLTLPAQDSVQLAYSFVGYETEIHTHTRRLSQTLNVLLTPGRVLAEVDVKADVAGEKVSESAQMSVIDIPIRQIKKIPAFLGEKDVLKVLQLMPGVQKGSEGQTGIYVRGGGPDQNLIILDDAVVYNASHLFGFFSVFNGDAIKSVELIKGGFPARFGGRLSSVIEMNLKDGNREKLHGEAGIGLISSRLTLEGPLTKNKKSSFLISGRRTYLDILAAPLINAETRGQTKIGYYFYDLNAKANYELSSTDKLYLSGYFGRDKFHARDKTAETNTGLSWGNATATLRWNHLFNQKLFSNASLIFSNYKFEIASTELGTTDNQLYSLQYNSGIRDFSLKYDVDYYPLPAHSVRIGIQSTYHRFTPSAVVLQNAAISQYSSNVNTIDVLESGIYAEDTWRPSSRWHINGGLRISHFQQKSVSYTRPEPRLSGAYTLKPNLSIKASYALMNQYVHLLSNTGIGLPTDLWVPTTDRVKPQQSQQIAIGLAKDYVENGLALTVEAYYKTMHNIINYKEGASFLLINDPTAANSVRWEDNITAGKGWSYGAEFLLQKKVGRFSGWIGYTLSWTQWQFADLNNGKPYYPRYDRRHDISLVGIYELNKRTTMSATWVYGTGNALTVPVARYDAYRPGTSFFYGNSRDGDGLIKTILQNSRTVDDYGTQKNSFRAESYHRFDVSVQFHKQKAHHERTWEVSVYNLYNRRNPYFYRLEAVDQSAGSTSGIGLFRYSVFPIVPSVSYNVKF